MKMCPGCAVEYPEGYLAPFEANKKKTMPVCGCCALALAQKGGYNMLCFRAGTLPERLRRLAIDWRRETKAVPRPLAVQLP